MNHSVYLLCQFLLHCNYLTCHFIIYRKKKKKQNLYNTHQNYRILSVIKYLVIQRMKLAFLLACLYARQHKRGSILHHPVWVILHMRAKKAKPMEKVPTSQGKSMAVEEVMLLVLPLIDSSS